MLTHRSAAFAAMRPTLLFSLEQNAARRKRNKSWSGCAGIPMKRKVVPSLPMSLKDEKMFPTETFFLKGHPGCGWLIERYLGAFY
jgi:hypothetical protein